MINLLSVRCSLAFAPYLMGALEDFIRLGQAKPSVVRQGGSGLVIRSDEDELIVGHQEREARLNPDLARHYQVVIDFRKLKLGIICLSDEVVFAATSRGTLLSFPQSEMWLETDEAAAVVRLFRNVTPPTEVEPRFPDWLIASVSGGRLLLSDQRNARWVLLGAEHVDQLERCIQAKPLALTTDEPRRSPLITVKGIKVRVQPAFRIADALEAFACSRGVIEFAEAAPESPVGLTRVGDRIELKVSDQRVEFDVREAGKWSAVIRAELEGLKAVQLEGNAVSTALVNAAGGRWVLQGGDEVLVPWGLVEQMRSWDKPHHGSKGDVSYALETDSVLLMSQLSCYCVALGREAIEALQI